MSRIRLYLLATQQPPKSQQDIGSFGAKNQDQFIKKRLPKKTT
jgi:hypothetical protein